MKFMADVEIPLNISLYKKVYLVRKVEIVIQENYSDNEMKTPMHMSMGSEHISAGVCQALEKNDVVFGTYRSHALYLCKTEETDKFFCEMYGKVNGVAKGKAGSMHLSNIEYGFMGSSAIVASIIPVAVGYAFANKYKKNQNIVVVFFGDGATEEGNFWESLNIACLMKLPILLVCEDNELAVHSPSKSRRGYNDLLDIVRQFNCSVHCDVAYNGSESIYRAASNLISQIRRDEGPALMRVKYYRYLQHVGVEKDFSVGYRSKEEFNKWFEEDPVLVQRRTLTNLEVPEEQILEIERAIDNKISKSIELAKKSPFPDNSELYKGVFNEY